MAARDYGSHVALIVLLSAYANFANEMHKSESPVTFELPARSLVVGGETVDFGDRFAPSGAAKEGQKVYEQYCIGCHGKTGEGNGLAAAWLAPKPRNFTTATNHYGLTDESRMRPPNKAGIFKFTTAEATTLPKKEDLLKTITEGLPGSSMPSFRLIAQRDRENLAEFILYLARNARFFATLKAFVGESELLELDEDEDEDEDEEGGATSDNGSAAATVALLFEITKSPVVYAQLKTLIEDEELVDTLDEDEADEKTLKKALETFNGFLSSSGFGTAADAANALKLATYIEDNDLPEVREGSPMFPTTKEPELSADSIKAGYVAYMKACAACHGEDAKGVVRLKGDGSPDLDDFGEPTISRDLTVGVYRHGTDSLSIWYRLKGGIEGSQMPKAALTETQYWEVAHYLRLFYEEELGWRYDRNKIQAHADLDELTEYWDKRKAELDGSIANAKDAASKTKFTAERKVIADRLAASQKIMDED